MSTEWAIRTKGLYKSFGKNEVLCNCSLAVERGTIYGFLGINGAGKTTMFKILTGLLIPTKGEVQVLGKDVVTQKADILKHIGSLIDMPVFYEHLSARENLEIHLAYMDVERADIEETLSKVGLQRTENQPVSEFSLGMRQRLAIARAMIHQPQLLILDEPVNGLDPVGIREMRDLFKSLVENHKVTILFSSHILSEVEHIAEKIGVISNGTVVREMTLHELKKGSSFNLEEYFISIVKEGKDNAQTDKT
ncbi:ABC transporter ATP-binding protein [Pseudogracilibacillus auburnensis]|uniref:ABC transporter ATP-binding protein n=1 Tax=Pseudogracilibacillus auburnensis TaxID=1494959 RepID=UPI001A978E13|nr:ATP-binding cassette domain-containing protein [Pseudogracilibacillus auburnensis]MBO1001214.1 ATP-binding cassette domain-containing protein [Pseudogracilibacillus auburnensis]